MPPALPPQTRPAKRDQSERRASCARTSSGNGPPGCASRSRRCSGSLHRIRMNRSSMMGEGPPAAASSRSRCAGRASPCPAGRPRGSRPGRRARARGRARSSCATRARSRASACRVQAPSGSRDEDPELRPAAVEPLPGLPQRLLRVIPVEEERLGIARQRHERVVGVAPGQLSQLLVEGAGPGDRLGRARARSARHAPSRRRSRSSACGAPRSASSPATRATM